MRLPNTISAYKQIPLASSEPILGTANYVYTDFTVEVAFSATPVGNKTSIRIISHPDHDKAEECLVTNDFSAVQDWAKKHKVEIEQQLKEKTEKWIEENKTHLHTLAKGEA